MHFSANCHFKSCSMTGTLKLVFCIKCWKVFVKGFVKFQETCSFILLFKNVVFIIHLVPVLVFLVLLLLQFTLQRNVKSNQYVTKILCNYIKKEKDNCCERVEMIYTKFMPWEINKRWRNVRYLWSVSFLFSPSCILVWTSSVNFAHTFTNSWIVLFTNLMITWIYIIRCTTQYRKGAYGHDPFLSVFEEHRLDSTTTDITTALFILYMSLYYLILWNQVDILKNTSKRIMSICASGRGFTVPRGTALCGTTLRPPEV